MEPAVWHLDAVPCDMEDAHLDYRQHSRLAVLAALMYIRASAPNVTNAAWLPMSWIMTKMSAHTLRILRVLVCPLYLFTAKGTIP